MSKVYTLIHHFDDNPFGEHQIEVFATREAARAQLKEDVERYFNSPWEAIELHNDDTLEPDHVSIEDGSGWAFWFIAEHEVKGVIS